MKNTIATEAALMRSQYKTPYGMDYYIARRNLHKIGYQVLQSIHVANKRVLDVGAFAGFVGWLCQERGALVTLIDIFDSVFPTWMNGVVGSKEDMPFPSNSFDVVVCMDTLHHGDLLKGVEEIHRVLIPGGIFVSLEEPCIGTWESETEVLARDCHKELASGICERRPNIEQYQQAFLGFTRCEILSGADLSLAQDRNYGGDGIVIKALK